MEIMKHKNGHEVEMEMIMNKNENAMGDKHKNGMEYENIKNV